MPRCSRALNKIFHINIQNAEYLKQKGITFALTLTHVRIHEVKKHPMIWVFAHNSPIVFYSRSSRACLVTS